MTTIAKSRRTKTNIRRYTDAAKPRYTTKPASQRVEDAEEKNENAWVMFFLGLILLLGVAFIVGITYVLLLG